MRRVSLLFAVAALSSIPIEAGGVLGRVFWRSGIERAVMPRPGVRMLELEIVQRPANVIAGDFARLQFKVKQLTNPDPQFVGPPVRLRRYSPSGEQLEPQWLQPNGANIYETSVPMRESHLQYLYFETGDERTVLAKVPWIVLRAAD